MFEFLLCPSDGISRCIEFYWRIAVEENLGSVWFIIKVILNCWQWGW